MILLTLPRRMACGLFVLSACQPSTQSAEEASAAAQSSSSSDPQNAGNPQDEAPEPGDDLTRNASAACPPPGLPGRTELACTNRPSGQTGRAAAAMDAMASPRRSETNVRIPAA